MPLRYVLLAIVMLSGQLGFTQEFKTVLAASRRTGYVEFYDPADLQTIGRVRVGAQAESVAASPDGQRIFVSQALPSDHHGCCALFALDLRTKSLCFLIEPASTGALSPDGHTLFVNRGDVGIDVINVTTSLRSERMDGPGNYSQRMYPSPNGHWLFAATLWKGPSLDIFDVHKRTLVRRLETPGADSLSGAWIGPNFHLYAQYGATGKLWQVTPESTQLGPGVSVPISGLSACSKIPALMTMVETGGRVFVYEPFGYKVDRLKECGQSVSGGVYALDHSSGNVIAHLSPSLYFMRVVAGADGGEMYGIDVRGPKRLIKLDPRTGMILVERMLDQDVSSLALAKILESILPLEEVAVNSCRQQP